MRKKPGVVPSLSHQQIIEEAYLLAKEIGLDNVSIRKLANRLDKTPMALYTYFSSQQEIIDGVITYIMSGIETAPIPGESWDDTIRRNCRSMRDLYLKHSDMNLESVLVPGWNNGKIEFRESVTAIHSEQGVPEDVLVKTWCTVNSFLNGFIYGELLEERHRRLVNAGALSAEKAEAVVYFYTDEAFEDGLDIIIDGIKQHAAPNSCKWETPAA